jgi:hypothetical protein
MRFLTSFALALALAATTSVASAQVYSVYSPIAGYTPAVTDYGYGPAYSPTVTYYAGSAGVAPVGAIPTTAYYAPAAVPTTTYYAPTAAIVPTTTYYAPAAVPVTSYYAPAAIPMTSYYAPAAVPVTAYYGAPRVWVNPKVYVAGEPVRNFFRAITP